MIRAKMNDEVDLVARAFYESDQEGCLWDNEPAPVKEQFREFARNAISLLNEDIRVLLASENASAEERVSMR
jgi:hypothetical protein